MVAVVTVDAIEAVLFAVLGLSNSCPFGEIATVT
jgi:hypothetical protein